MRRLYADIAGRIVLAVGVGWLAVALSTPLVRGVLEEGLREQVLGAGLRWVAARMDEVPTDQWPEQLAEAQRQLTIPLEIVATGALTRAASAAVSPERPTISRAGSDTLSIYIPLHAGSHFLVAGPLAPPPVAPFVVGALIFVVVMIATASAAVGMPLVRRLRTLRNAIGELGGGNWAVRLDANAEGALSELAESINRTAAQLQRQFQEREALLQAVSHEIGTPLSRMRFQVELLENESHQPEQLKRLRALSEDLDELDELSTELVAWMEPEPRGRLREEFQLRPVLESLVELACDRARKTPEVQLAVPGGVTVFADRRQFQRAIENLLSNAVRYAQGRVILAAEVHDASVLVEVRDDGPGIPSTQRPRVLEPFIRLDNPHSRAHRGLGLGLAIVRRIVEGHGGTVAVAEASEGGTAVRTTWPSPAAASASNVAVATATRA